MFGEARQNEKKLRLTVGSRLHFDTDHVHVDMRFRPRYYLLIGQ